MPPVLAPGSTYVRESWRARIDMKLILVGFLPVLYSRTDGDPHVAWLVFWALLVIGELYRSWRPVATMTPTMIVVNNVRPKEVAWHRIRDITTAKRVGSARIVLEIDNGDRVVMDGPTGGFLVRGHFDATLEQIRRAWTERRGTSRAADAQQPGSGEQPAPQ